MRTKNILFPAILLISALFVLNQGCDKIESPYVELVSSDTIGGNGHDTTVHDVRKILLEDFTGHKCPNCPEAAIEAQNLKAKYGEQLIIMSVHAGNFATTDSEFTYDFRTPEGNDLNGFYQVYFYPAGIVNRSTPDGAASPVLFKSSWDGAIAGIIDRPQEASIRIINNYNPATRELETTFETEFLAALEGTYHITAYILESGIIKPQQSEAGVIHDYEHNHVLRTSMNGTWGGTVCSSGNAIPGVVFENVASITLDEEWVVEECEVVAVVYRFDSATREIIQAEEKEIVNSK